MHAVVSGRLEEYLSGTLEPVVLREIEAHLDTCELCREETAAMAEQSHLLASLRSEEGIEPAPGFYGRVMALTGQPAPPTFASLFGWDFAFGRRLVFASLLTLAVLGSYLVSREGVYPTGPSPVTVMAQQESPAFDSAPAQDAMLVTLTAYEH